MLAEQTCFKNLNSKDYMGRMVRARGEMVYIEGPLSPSELRNLQLDQKLNTFRQPKEQLKALVEIAELEKGRIYGARVNDMLVGYVTFHPPDGYERWGQAKLTNLIELGAIEISPNWRGAGLGNALLELMVSQGWLEKNILFATEYYWHWDLEATGLSVWQYRNMMEKLFRKTGMEPASTDDPEICCHAANMLMVRIGQQVTQQEIEEFDKVRMQGFALI